MTESTTDELVVGARAADRGAPGITALLFKSTLVFMMYGLAACSSPVTSVDSASGNANAGSTNAEASVRPHVNRQYKNPNLDVGTWAKRFTGESREVFAERLNILAALHLEPGDRIADIGAGTGLYVKLFAESVGPTGKVYAVDISQPFLDFIAENAAADNLENVATVRGADRSTNLADASVDVVFHSDTYHHFEYPNTMVRDLARVLDEDGEMFVLDFERIEGVTSEGLLNHVRAGKAVVIAEIEASGFDLIEEIALPGLRENYLLRFEKERPASQAR